jgi:hypothetical protein
MATEVRFGEWLSKGFDLYKQNIGVLILAGLVTYLITLVSAGILAGPMTAGMVLICLHIVDGKPGKPEVGTVFQGFGFFLPTFLFVLVWGILVAIGCAVLAFIPCVGWIAAIAGAYVLATLLMFGLFLIVERKMDFWPASLLSMQTVKPHLFPLLGFVIVSGLIGSLGMIACFVGVFVTMPIPYLMLTVAYREFFPAGGETPAQAEPAAQPPAAG